MRILLDVTRSLAHRHNSTPTGIDRVEHAFISRLLERHSFDVHFIVTTPYGTGALSREAMKKILDSINANWETERAAPTSLYAGLRACLEKPPGSGFGRAIRFQGEKRRVPTALTYLSLFQKSLAGRRSLRNLAKEAGRVPTLYLHTSHIQLEDPRLYDWTRRSNVRSAFLIHDLIPIDYPEFCGRGTVEKHHRRMATVAALGSAIIVNSAYTGERLERYLDDRKLGKPPILLSRLGTEVAGNGGMPVAAPRAETPYFLYVGTLEGRKNVTHLLNIWRVMLAREGPARTPRLVLAGRRGWRCQNVFDVLDHSHELANHVVEVSDLKDAELAALMKGACALLSPSLVEGYGLPAAEAVCSGLPVLASDIPAHREILGDSALLLDPTDGPGWRQAILSLAGDAEFRAGRVAATRIFKPVSWAAHVDHALDQVVASIEAN